jgi:DNA-binding NarL/FixJ family response regulator
VTRITVAMADDQRLFCTGMQHLIESQPDLEFVGSAVNGYEAIALARDYRPDVFLMDIRMPVLDGIDATTAILKPAGSSPRTRIIMLTTFQRDQAVLRAIDAGAEGFVLKDSTPEFMLEAIRSVHAGRSVIAPTGIADILRERKEGPAASIRGALISGLSTREREVFFLTASGLSNGDIARSSFISETTVKSHVSSILAKLALTSRVQIVAFAYENNLMGRPSSAQRGL